MAVGESEMAAHLPPSLSAQLEQDSNCKTFNTFANNERNCALLVRGIKTLEVLSLQYADLDCNDEAALHEDG